MPGGGKHLGRVEVKQHDPFMTSPLPYSQIFGVIILLKFSIMLIYSYLSVIILLVFDSNMPVHYLFCCFLSWL